MSPIPSIRDLFARLDACTVADARRLHARLRGLTRHGRAPQPPAEVLAQAAAEIERAAAKVEARAKAIPKLEYPADLPVAARKNEIIAAIREHQVTVVCGATGSGKTTQLPKMLLELGRGTRGFLGHTQPRRIAARSVAQRIAHELGTSIGGGGGGVVGYKVRFTDHTSPQTLVKVMTDGILLAETQHDRHLSQYDALIIDEAHERSLNIDFLLGYLRQLLPRRPDLKVVITSATIDPASFAAHFALPGKPKPPIIEVSGRTYPVEMRYRPLEAQHPDEEDRDQEQAILHAIDELSVPSADDPKGEGDILVFLPGEREIRETADALRKHPLRPTHRVDVIPLFARLSADEQQRVFDPHPGRRRIILATNVAETSLTVPGIKYVIDSGVARISRYSPRIKVQRLPIEPISQASANQRAGRCGRTSPGVCIRLYSEQDFTARPEFTDPEILRTNLASVILQMKALELGEIEAFPFIQPPDPRTVRDGYDTLLEIHALEGGGLRNDLTQIGRQLARLPIDPRIGRMVIAADAERCIAEVLVIAAALSTQDPRERPMEKQAEADAAHALFRDPDGGSDFLGILRLWRELHRQQKNLSSNQFRKWCREHFVSYLRFREWHDTHTQLQALITEMGFRINPPDKPGRPDNIHRALMTGLLSSIGRKNEASQRDIMAGEGEYDGARGLKFNIFPGSVLFKKAGPGEKRPSGPKWVVAAEIVKTTRTYARTAAAIAPQWIEPLAQHLVKRTYAEPHWNADLAQACVYETQTLYGLEIVKRRRVPLEKIDPAVSRTLFIHHALVEGEYLTNAKFFEHNHDLTLKVKQMQERARTSDLLADNATRFAFYDRRVPKDVITGPQFEQWRKRAESREPTLLVMEKQDVLAPGVHEPAAAEFPEILTIGGEPFRLEYRHEPGHREDGVTIIVPLEKLAVLSEARLDWLVPGYLPEKIAALIRELPKGLRVAFVPVPQTVDAAIRGMKFGSGDFLDALGDVLRRNTATGVQVPREAWKMDLLAAHLRMNIRVVDQKGKTVITSRDLAEIRREFLGQTETTLLRLPEGRWHRTGIMQWEDGPEGFDPLPESVDARLDGRTVTLYPALHDERVGLGVQAREQVALRSFTTREKAHAAHEHGVRTLFWIATRRECRSLIDTMPGIEKLRLNARAMKPAGEPATLVEQLAELTAQRAWESAASKEPIRSRAAFERALNERWTRIGASGAEVFALAEAVVAAYRPLAAYLDEPDVVRPEWLGAFTDIRVQMAYLFASPPPVGSFWTRTPYAWLREYPRYLNAVRRRIEKLSLQEAHGGGVARDTRLLNEFTPLWNQLRIRAEQGGPAERSDPNLIQYRWMLEEYRVVLWGGDQRTIVPVSAKRLAEQWGRVIGAAETKP